MKRAAICVGVNRAGTMTPLRAASRGARDFGRWASATQGCDTTLLVDRGKSKVSVTDIFDAVVAAIDAGTYDQLIVYFSGHGILTAPGAEYWLLSRAPDNPNEAVNLFRSIEEARNSGIPHVVFISDACRSSVQGPPLSGVSGGSIFPSRAIGPRRSEIDVFYATRPGDPAYEVPEATATERYRGIFTDSLLRAVKAPDQGWIESVAEGTTRLAVVTSRNLKTYLEESVAADAAEVDIKLRQQPELRVETALPKFFAVVDPHAARPATGGAEALAPRTVEAAIAELGSSHFAPAGAAPAPPQQALADELGLTAEVQHLVEARGRGHFETETGFSVFGVSTVNAAALRWAPSPADPGDVARHVRLDRATADADSHASSIVLEFDGATGTVLPVLPGFIGTVVVENGRTLSVNYVPSDQTGRFQEYLQRANELEAMKAFAAVASRHGRFTVENEKAGELAGRIRQAKSIDPTMGIYAAYAYAQAGQFDDVYSVFTYMNGDELPIPVPFDVLMLATRFKADAHADPPERVAPFAPVLSQGWALIAPGDALHLPIHEDLRPHLIPSLWTTLDAAGVTIARDAILAGAVR